jgi:MYXO-CTERM domain-containing protein
MDGTQQHPANHLTKHTMKPTSLLHLKLATLSIMLAAAAPAAAATINWLDMSPTTVNTLTPVPNASVFTIPGYGGTVTMTYNMPGAMSSGRGSLAGWQTGSAGPHTWTNHEYFGAINYNPGTVNDAWDVTYSFSVAVPAGSLFVGTSGLGKTTNDGGRTTLVTVLQNGTFLGDWTGGGPFGASLFTGGAGVFTMENTVTGAGGADPWWNTHLGVVEITDNNLTSITLRVSQIQGDGIGVNIGMIAHPCVNPDGTPCPEPGSSALAAAVLGLALSRRKRA